MSDLLIKNMYMPTDDVLRIEIYPDGKVRRIVGWAISEKRDSTAVEVPPHGRLIDADELIEKVLDGDRPNYGTVVRFIQEAPVILEATK